MHSDNVWNDLELQNVLENNVSKACILTLLEMIGNWRENFEYKDGKWCILTPDDSWNFRGEMKTMSLKHALWRYAKRFGTAEKMHSDGI